MEGRLKYQQSEESRVPDVETATYQRYTVDRGINSSRTVQFVAEGLHDSFIDLNGCYLKTVFRVKDEDGSEMESNDFGHVFPTENYGTNLWSQVDISLNNTPLPPGNDYPYTAMLIDMLGAAPDARTTVMEPLAGFNIPNYGSGLVKDALSYDDAKELCKDSNAITVYDRIHSDFLMSCSQILPSKIQLAITLTRSKDSFVLGTMPRKSKDKAGKDVFRSPGNYKVDVESVSLFVRRLGLNSAAQQLADASLSRGGKLLYQRLHTIPFPCAKGTLTWTWRNCFHNTVPRRVFLCFVNQEGYFGSYERCGNYLESADVRSVRFQVNGREVMPEPYTCDFKYKDDKLDDKKSDATSAYAGLCRVIGSFNSPQNHVGVSYPYFLNGATVFAVAMEHEQTEGPERGSLDVVCEFRSPTKEPLMAIVMGEYPRAIAFDSNRTITEP